ncbi:MAG: glycosyltransferase [Candidatus Omnitrophica bacterium]|nr:glycosyltransferase [Candidatus Omnitrophota bacterium]
MKFSVIVPFLNEEKYIRKCAESLLSQEFDKSEYELIFIDNGSTDNSVAIVKQFREIKLLYENRRNVYAARNSALEIAKGGIIVFTDADCVVSKDWLAQISRGMDTCNADIVLGRVFSGRKISRVLKIVEDYHNTRIKYILANRLNRYYYGYTNNMAIKVDIFRKLGKFKEWPIPGDTEIIHRCQCAYPGFKIAYLDDMRVVHLEVTNLAIWMKKIFFYGKHNIILEKTYAYSPLDFSLRRKITLHCFKVNRYGFFKKILSVFILRLCGFVYQSGRIAGKITFSRF